MVLYFKYYKYNTPNEDVIWIIKPLMKNFH